MSRTYTATHYHAIHSVEREHFWFVARNEMIRSMVGRFMLRPQKKTFLDVGCGTGIVLTVLERMGCIVTGLDVNHRALLYAKKLTKSTLVRSSIFQYHPGITYDAVGAFDVMEHIGNDTGFLTHCSRLLQPGGHIFLTVPAEKYLWSHVDVVSGHQRRYTVAELRSKLLHAGFRIEFVGYWNSILLPVYMGWRLLGGTKRTDVIQRYLKKPHPVFNATFLTILRFEQTIGVGTLPFGATLVAVGKKV